jgi:hypothetical protein
MGPFGARIVEKSGHATSSRMPIALKIGVKVGVSVIVRFHGRWRGLGLEEGSMAMFRTSIRSKP